MVRPPECEVCGRSCRDVPDGPDDFFTLVHDKLSPAVEEAQRRQYEQGWTGHPPGARWFCKDHMPIAAAVIVSNGRLLLVKRRVEESGLSWQLPAGKLEAGETLEDAAVRETAEEVDLEVSAVELLGERVHPVTGRRVGYVVCDIISGDAKVAAPDEIDDLAWAAREELKTYVPNGFAPVVEEYLIERLSA